MFIEIPMISTIIGTIYKIRFIVTSIYIRHNSGS